MAEVVHVPEEHTSDERRYPQREGRKKEFPGTVQYMAVCDSVRSEPMPKRTSAEQRMQVL
jgi:hypothetical protein